MGDRTHMYKREEISLEDYKLYFEEWLEKEKSLRLKVTKLYDIAYDTGCL